MKISKKNSWIKNFLYKEPKFTKFCIPQRFCIPVNERSPEEEKRLKILEEERTAKEAEKKARKGFKIH